jgi:hypothetical protein
MMATPPRIADSMRFVQTETSADAKSRGASPRCIAFSALAAFCCPDSTTAPLPSSPLPYDGVMLAVAFAVVSARSADLATKASP